MFFGANLDVAHLLVDSIHRRTVSSNTFDPDRHGFVVVKLLVGEVAFVDGVHGVPLLLLFLGGSLSHDAQKHVASGSRD